MPWGSRKNLYSTYHIVIGEATTNKNKTKNTNNIEWHLGLAFGSGSEALIHPYLSQNCSK